MRGKLFVIDGLDGSGKTTQNSRVARLLAERMPVRAISFPDYGDESSALVRMYLRGDFGQDANGVNPYAASSFYAVDRYAAYVRHWRDFYLSGGVVLAARYVSSNAIHQMSKLPREEWDGFLSWLSEYEYGKLGLPRPDRILFLDMPRRVADGLLLSRYRKDGGKEDIHERDRAYLARCEEAAAYAARAEGWTVIPCAKGDAPLPVEEITEKILEAIGETLTLC